MHGEEKGSGRETCFRLAGRLLGNPEPPEQPSRNPCPRRPQSMRAGLAVRAPVFPARGLLDHMTTAPASLQVIVFPGGFNWPIWAAQANGFFASHGVDVNLTPTPNSIFQLTSLIDGKFDIAMTAIDNVIAYVEGQDSVALSVRPDLIAVMGGDNGFLRLVASPEITSCRDLKGKQVSVDALTTGYAFVLRKLLEKAGLAVNDYDLVSAGGVRQRFQALLARQHAGTLLVSPFDVFAKRKKFNCLADAAEVLGHYQGAVAATRREWATAHRHELVGFIGGYIAGLDWLFEPANKPAAIALLRKFAEIDEDDAEQSYRVLLHPAKGFARDAGLDFDGIRTVLALRAEYGLPRTPLGEPEKYCDLSFYHEARRKSA